MTQRGLNQSNELEPVGKGRRVRSDARRNLDSLLQAATAVFKASGVDAPVREIAKKAGVGVGTVYRHFPNRADLIAAVFRREIDGCADEAPILAGKHEPFEALAKWLQRYAAFVATKRGFARTLHTADPAYQPLPAYRSERLEPALRQLLEAAVADGAVLTEITAEELLDAIGSLCINADLEGPRHAQRMVAIFVDGLRYGGDAALRRANAGRKGRR